MQDEGHSQHFSKKISFWTWYQFWKCCFTPLCCAKG